VIQMAYCFRCKVFVSSLTKHLARNRCERVIEKRETERGQKPLKRGTRNGQKIDKNER
jgi:hypothetical protein